MFLAKKQDIKNNQRKARNVSDISKKKDPTRVRVVENSQTILERNVILKY